MKTINIIGSIFGTTGYDSHTRGLANGLVKLTKCRLSTQLAPNWQRMVNDKELEMIQQKPEHDDINLIVSMPHSWKMYTGLGKNVGYCVWEGDKVPVSWLNEFMNPDIDLIIVPSEHTKQAIWNTYFSGEYEYMDKEILTGEDKEIWDKIKVIPHGVDRSIFYKMDKSEDKKDGVFRFICNKGWRGTSWDRGGVQYLIKAFAEEFNKDEKTELTLKLNPAYINPQLLEGYMKALNLPKDRAKINICVDNVPFDKMGNFYKDGDCFVCATRAEAFNLPGLEAMSCGLPTIQTNYGGQVDYMTNANSFPIDYKLEEVKEDLMYEGIKWAVPDHKDLKKQMRFAFENQDMVKDKGKIAEDDSKNWTWDKSAEKMINIFENI